MNEVDEDIESFQIFKEFFEFQEKNGVIPEDNGFHEYPEYYSFVETGFHEAILLEDLKQRNFEMFNYRDEDMTYDHAYLAITVLAKYHALSFAMKDKRPDKFKSIITNIRDTLSVGLKKLYDSCQSRFYEILGESGSDIKDKIRNKFGDSLYAALATRTNEVMNGPHAVIGHGDFKINNKLFKYDEVIFGSSQI